MAKSQSAYNEVIDSVSRAYRTLITGEFSNVKNVAGIIVARKQLRVLKGAMRGVVGVIDVVTSQPNIDKRVKVFNKVLKTVDIKTISSTVGQFGAMKVSKKKVNKSLDTIEQLLRRLADMSEKYKDISKNKTLKETLNSIDELCKQTKETTDNINGVTKNINAALRKLTVASILAVAVRPVILTGLTSMKLIFEMLGKIVMRIKIQAYRRKMRRVKRLATEIVVTMTSLALGLLAVATLMVTNIKQITVGLLGFAVVVGLAVGVLMLLSVKGIRKRAARSAATLMMISVAFIGFAATTLILGMFAGVSLKALISFTAVIGVAVGVMFLIGAVRKFTKQGVLTLALISLAFIGFAATTLLLSYISAEMNTVGLLVFLGMVVGAAVVVWLIGKFTGSILKGVLAMALVGVALILFTIPVMIISNLNANWENFGYFAAVVGLGVALCVGVSFALPFILPGTLAMALVGVALILFTVPVKTISELDVNWENFGYFAAVVGTGVALCVSASFALPFIIPGTVAMALVGGSMYLFAGVMKKISEINVNQEGIDMFRNNIQPLVRAFRDGVKGVGVKDILKMKAVYGELSSTMLDIARAYDIIGKIDVDYETLAVGVNRLVTSAISAFLEVSNDPEVSLMLQGRKKDTTIWKILRLSKDIGRAMGDLAVGVRDMASLTVTEYDNNGKVTGKRKLTNEDFVLAGNGTTKIITALFGALQNTDNETLKEMLGGRLKKTTAWKAIEVAKEMGGAISSLALGIKDLSTLTFKDENGKEVRIDIDKGIDNTTKLIAGTITGLAGLETDNNVPGYLRETGKSIQTFAEATNSLDLSKAKAMQGLLDKLAEFGKGVNYNFKELADIINGRLVEALENLKETLEGINTKDDGSNPNEEPAYTPTGNVTMPAPSTPAGTKETLTESNLSNIEKSLRSIEETLQDINTIGIGVKVKNFDEISQI